MLDHHDASWWNDPEHTAATLLSAISSSLDDDLVLWYRVDAATGQVSLLDVADQGSSLSASTDPGWAGEFPDDEFVVAVARSGRPWFGSPDERAAGRDVIAASVPMAGGDLGVLVAVRRADRLAHVRVDQRRLQAGAERLTGEEASAAPNDDGIVTVGAMQRLFGVQAHQRWLAREILIGAGLPAAITAIVLALPKPDSYHPAVLLLLACVVTAELAGARAAVLAGVTSAVALWWAFTPPERSWSVGSVRDFFGILVFLAAVIGVTALIIRLDETRHHDHIERQLADTLLDQSPVAMAVFDRELRCRRANELMAVMDGHPEAEHLGRSPSQLSGQWAQLYEHLLIRVRDDGQPIIGHPLTLTVPRLGLERHWRVSLRPLFDHDSEVVGIGAVFADVTAEIIAGRQAEQLIHLAESLSTAIDRQQVSEYACDYLVDAFRCRCVLALLRGGTLEVVSFRGLSRSEVEAVVAIDEGTSLAALYADAGERASLSVPLRSGPPNTSVGVIHLSWLTARTIGTSTLATLGTLSSLVAMALARIDATEGAHRDQFRNALDSMLDEVTIGRAVRGPDGQIDDFVLEFVNSGGPAGDTAHELVGRHVSDLHPDWRTSGMLARVCDVVETGVPYRGERLPYSEVGSGGVPHTSYWNVQFAKLGDGYISSSRDVAEVMVAEAAALAATVEQETERTAIALMQAAALPAVLPAPPGVVLAAVYAPADHLQPIGGDWYDAFVLDNGRLGMVIADVGGHGHQAAVFMVQVRNVFRALADEHDDPAEVMRRANDVTTGLSAVDGPFVTCCYAVLDLTTRVLTWAQAGHFSPLVVHPSGSATYLVERPGPPLAISGHQHYRSSSAQLHPGDRVLMFTDGLVERRRELIDIGIARLGRVAVEHAALPPDHLVNALADSVQDRFDDLALLCVALAADPVV